MFQWSEELIPQAQYSPLFVSAITVAENLALALMKSNTSQEDITRAYVAAFAGIMEGCAAKGEKT